MFDPELYYDLPRWLRVHVCASYLAAVVVAVVAIVSGTRHLLDAYHLLFAPIWLIFAGAALLGGGPLTLSSQRLNLVFVGVWVIACAPSIIRYYTHAFREQRIDRRLRAGQCPRCGYSLRATRARCPECGFVPGRDDPTEDMS
jgi:hypothetical protein